MRKRYILLLFFLASNAVASPLGEGEAKEISAACVRMAEAVLAERHEEVVSLLYPEMVKAAGGAERLVQALAVEAGKNRSAGVVVHSLVLTPRATFADGERYRVVLVDSVLVAEAYGRKMRSTSFQVAFRELSGAQWYLLDGTNLREVMFRSLFKGLPGELKLPEVKREME